MVHSLFFVFLVVDRSIFYLTTRLIYNLLLSHRNMSIVLITAPVHRYLSYQAPLFVCLFIYLCVYLFVMCIFCLVICSVQCTCISAHTRRVCIATLSFGH